MNQKFSSRVAVSPVLAAILATGLFSQAQAQTLIEPSPISGLLSGLPGATPVQSAAGRTTEDICPSLGPTVGTGTGQERLSDTCTRLVVSALVATDQIAPGGDFDLGLSVAELNTALQAVAPEEMTAAGRVAVEGSISNPINGRLLALRGGGRGLLLSQSGLNLNGQHFSLAQLLPEGSRGGGAGDGELGGRWGGFVNGNFNAGDRDGTVNEDSFDFTDAGITAGVDYRISDALVAGAALSWSKTDADFDNNLGSVESDNYGLSLYASYATEKWYVDGRVGFSKIDFDTERRIRVVSNTAAEGIDTVARGSTDGDQLSLNLGAGCNIDMAGMTLTPYGRIDYLKLDVDGFTEREDKEGMGLTISDNDTESLQSAIGVRLAKAISTASGVVSPYAGVEWNHEYENDENTLVAKYANDPFNKSFVIPTDDPDRDFFTLSIGASAVFPRGLSAFVNVDTVLGLSETSSYALTVGGRLEF